MEILFWTAAAVVAYVYIGYPLLLWLIRRLRGPCEPRRTGEQPTVTLMISAFNEQDVIGAKLRNTREIEYPRDLLQVLVISDASDDRTDQIVGEFAGEGVELLRMPARGGKTAGLNAAMARATGEIVVFSDANALYRPDSIAMLVRNFGDTRVGAVVGESTYVDAEAASEHSEGLYWWYETGIKLLESQVGSAVGGDGAIYAVRRRLYAPMPADALSDFVNPLQVVRAGYRCIYEPAAQSYERAADTFRKEFRRKVRIVNRAWRATMSMRELLNPLRFGMFSIMLISHKLLRWLAPFFLLALLAANAALLDDATVYRVTMALQLAGVVLALIGLVLRHRRSLPALFSVPFYFALVNVASAAGIVDALRGKTYTTWNSARARESAAGQG
jgi:cellulose synthase/poly-beta-1,6-N-acetylglucosamine synthase-like glycosyltransferase